MKNNIIYMILFASSLCGIVACKQKAEHTQKTDENIISLTDAQMNNVNFTLVSLAKKEISTPIKLYGKIEVPPQNLVSVSFPLGGYLYQTQLLAGMHVSKGEVIAMMEDQQFVQLQQDYLIAKSKLQLTTLEYQRQKELNQSQASSDKMMQQAYANMQQEQALLKGLSEKLSLIHINPNDITEQSLTKRIAIYSPIDGFVSKVNVNVGKYVSPTDVLFELINPTDIHLNLTVYEKDINQLFIGQQVTCYSNINPAKRYHATIILISKNIDNTGKSEVHCHFEKYDKSLLPGMYMNAELDFSTTLSNALPDEAVTQFESQYFVFAQVAKQQYRMIPVQIGKTHEGFTEILNASDVADQAIVSEGSYVLLMKAKNMEEDE